MKEDKKNKKSKISVVIPTARSQFISNTLSALMNQTVPPLEIILVDNSSTSEESEKMKKIAEKFGVRYIREKNEGLHNARNRGVIEAKGEIVQFIDDDAIPDRKLIEEMEKIYQEYNYNNIGIVAGRVIPEFSSEPPEYMKYMKFSYLSIIDYGEKIIEGIDFIVGANISFPKDVYISAGGSNPDIFSSKKNIWFCGDGESGLLIKVKRMGKKIIYNPHAIVKHIIHRDRFELKFLKKRAFIHGIQMSYSKFFGGKFPPRQILLMRGLSFLLLSLANNIMSKIVSPTKSPSYQVMSSLYLARGIYEIKLIYDSNLRKHVSKENWIQELLQKDIETISTEKN